MDRTIPGHITGLYLFTVVNLLALFHVTMVHGEITVMDDVKNITIATYDDMPALFGSSLPMGGINGMLVYVNPHNACTTIDRPPRDVPNPRAWIALIAREGCDFAQKILNAQRAGYSVGIVHNKEGEEGLVPMSPGHHGQEVNIPSVFVAYSTGMDMADNFDYKKRNIIVNVDGEIPLPNYKIYLWPFAIVVGICFLLMLVFMLIKWCIDRRRRNRSRLSTKHLKKIPIKKFKKGDSYDVCAICLDDYEEGEKLRILPCNHSYHRKCIDPWLTKNKKTCPICKRRVIPGEENESDSETEGEGGATSTERTPLLGNQSASSSRTSTFDRSGLPEVVRGDVSTLHPQNDDSDSVNSLHGAVGQTLIQVEDRKQIAVTSSDNSVLGGEQEEIPGAVGGHPKEEVVKPKESRRKPRKERRTHERDEIGAVGGAEATVVDESKTEKHKKLKKTKPRSSSSKTKSKKPKTKASSSAAERGTEDDTEALLTREDNPTLTGEDNSVLSDEEATPKPQGTTQTRADNSRNSSPGGASNHSQDDVTFTTETKRPKHNQIV